MNGSQGLITCTSTWVHAPKITSIQPLTSMQVHNHQNEAVHVHVPAGHVTCSPKSPHDNGCWQISTVSYKAYIPAILLIILTLNKSEICCL